jgi:hypothetical protein
LLKFAQHEKNEEDHDDESEAPAAVVSRPIERAAANSAEPPKQCDNYNIIRMIVPMLITESSI